VWSAGCVMYELCTLMRPSISFRRVDAALHTVKDRGYGEDIVHVLGRMLTVDPTQRATAKECGEQLKAIADRERWPMQS